jgi:acyl carrier protein
MKISTSALQALIRKNRISSDETLSTDTALREQGFDSLSVFTFFFFIEEEFNVRVPQEQRRHLDTLQQISDYLSSNVQ